MAELENIEEPPEKRSRPNEEENGVSNGGVEGEEDDEDDEEEEMISVAGKMVGVPAATELLSGWMVNAVSGSIE